jgi:ABC-2 type transport system permease protein
MGVKQRRHGLVDFLLMTFKINVQSAMEYRFNFLLQAFGMFLNDIAFLAFWIIVYNKFQLINGWNLSNVLMMLAIIDIAFGAAMFFFGNCTKLSEVISKGGLDYYLVLPKPVLLHILVTRSSFSGIGDVLFGTVLAIYLFSHSIGLIPLFLLLTTMSGIIMVSLCIASGSLAFFFGGRGDLQQTLLNAILTLSTYPFSIFGGAAKIILLTLIPIGFITGIPVLILQNFSQTYLMYMVIATAASVIVAYSLFKFGLRHYESGNAINVQI